MMNLRRSIGVLAIALSAAACENNNSNENLFPYNPIAPIVDREDLIEFRVVGELPFPVVVRIQNAIDGLTQVTTLLPYSHTIANLSRESMFVSLEARGTGVGFLHVAIFLNGTVFREGSSTQNNPVVSVNGTYRRGDRR